MLTKFSVSNYRGFEGRVTLDLSHPREYQFNTDYVTDGVITNALVIGPNASGKTNLLNAISDVRSNYYPSERSFAIPGRDEGFVNANAHADEAEFEYEFTFGDTPVTYRYSKDSSRRVTGESLAFDGQVVFECGSNGHLMQSNLGLIGAESLNWTYSGDYSSALAYVSSNAPVSSGSTLDSLRAFTTKVTMVIHDGWGSANLLQRILGEVIRRGMVSELEDFLHEFGIGEDLVVLKDADGGESVYCRYARPVPLARCISGGTKTLVSLFYAYRALPLGTLYLLDEFDAYCHFELADRLVRYFGSVSGCQTIATTHNTSLVRNDVMRPDCIFKFGSDGSLRALSERTARELRFGNNVERLLRNGEFD